MATGFVTGTAALFKGKHTDATANQIAESIKQASISEWKTEENIDKVSNEKTTSGDAFSIEKTINDHESVTSDSALEGRTDTQTSSGAIEEDTVNSEESQVEEKTISLEIPFLDVQNILSFDYTKIPKTAGEIPTEEDLVVYGKRQIPQPITTTHFLKHCKTAAIVFELVFYAGHQRDLLKHPCLVLKDNRENNQPFQGCCAPWPGNT